ncbi:hypothetical protein [Nocardiopsis kunsanensis]|nr:hypothetical protein [Nocardiopsis kunsanensis]
MRQVLDGREEGPVWEWSPVGKLVLQGVLHHPYGRVGPWHEWDETDRLVSETIYDALGNRIIDRRLDEVGNIAHEERYEPARLWRDPETGQERPAPWLWLCPDRGCSRCHRCASTTVDECRHCHPRVLAVTERE